MRSMLLLSTTLALLAGAAMAQVPEPPPAPPGPRVFPPSDGPGDVDPSDRRAAKEALFAPYFNEAFKQNMLAAIARQHALYPTQTAGASGATAPAWTALGPTSDRYTSNGVTLKAIDSGRLRSIIPDPANTNSLLILTAGGGLWRTDNLLAGKPTWTPLSDGGTTTSGGAAAIGRSFDTIYVGLGDPFETTLAVGGVIVQSTDGGATFSAPISLPNASQVREVAVDTSAAQDIVLVGTDAGLFRSADGGATYTQVTGGSGQALAGLGVWSIKQTSAGWLATAVSPQLGIAASSPGAVAISTDHGATWTPIADTTSFASSGRITLAVGAAGDAIVYAIASNTSGYDQSDMFRSTDGGQTWAALGLASKTPANPNCYQTNLDLLNGQAYYNQSLLVDPADKSRNTVYAGGNLSLAKTTDGGNSFTLVGNWLPGSCSDGSNNTIAYVHADHHTNAVIKSGSREFLAFGTDGGLFLSDNAGSTFDSSKNAGIVSMLTETVASSPARDAQLVIGLQDNGVRARFFGSTVWEQIFGGDGEGVGASQANTRTAIVSGYYLNIYGIKGGLTPSENLDQINNRYYFAQTGLDLTDPDYFPFFTPIATPTAAADPTGGVFFTLTGSTLYKTRNGGNSWFPLVRFANSSGPESVFRLSWNEIGVSPKDQTRIAVGGTGGGAVITTDSFKSTLTYVGLNSLGLGYASYNSSAAWAPDDSIYFSSQAPTIGATRVLKTSDFGKTWSAASTGLPDVPVNQVIADPSDATGHTLYAATWIGVYASHDGGGSWTLLGAGLPTVQVSGLSLSPSTHKLRAATYGRGVWEITP